jgi:hypothetical protein
MIWQSSCLRQIEQFLLAASSDQSEIEDKMSRQSDSNRRPADYKSAALPTELCRHLRGKSAFINAPSLGPLYPRIVPLGKTSAKKRTDRDSTGEPLSTLPLHRQVALRLELVARAPGASPERAALLEVPVIIVLANHDVQPH